MISYTTDADGRVTHIHSDGHLLLTGPIRGTVTTHDGTVIDVGPDAIEVADEVQAAEVAHLIGIRYEAEGHPDDVEVDEKGGLVQRPFIYVAPAGGVIPSAPKGKGKS